MKLLKNYVELETKGTAKKSDIIIPGTAKPEVRLDIKTKVINVGPDVTNVKVGDEVVLREHAFREKTNVIKVSETYLHEKCIVNEDDIIAIL